jgi:hypothetical protein
VLGVFDFPAPPSEDFVLDADDLQSTKHAFVVGLAGHLVSSLSAWLMVAVCVRVDRRNPPKPTHG